MKLNVVLASSVVPKLTFFLDQIFTPILHWIEGRDGAAPKPLEYPYGSRGPKELEDFVKKYGYKRSQSG